MNWQQLFAKHILDRGYDYFCDDAVENLKHRDNTITATVCGTQDYDVEITLGEDMVKDMYCSCPYAEAGSHCKHMAAVLFAWESDGEGVENCNQDNPAVRSLEQPDRAKTERKQDEIEKIVGQADESVVRDFLADILRKDEKLSARFKRLVVPEISAADMKKYKSRVNASIRKYLGRNHFISYYEARGFIREMEEYLYEDARMMLDAGSYLSAFELTCYVFVKVGNVDMDDSDGGIQMLAWHCQEIWKEILESADNEVKQTMYEWFTEHLNGSIIDYMEEYIEQMLMDNFKEKKYLEAKLAYTDRRVRKAKKDSDGDSWHERFYVVKWALYHINLMEESGYDLEEIFRYCKENWKYVDVRKFYIAKCTEYKRYDEAISALEESRQIDAGMPGLVREYSIKLKELFLESGRKEEYRQQLWSLVTKGNPGNVEEFKELKGLYSEEEWGKVREEIFAQVPPHSRIDRLYKEEELYDRLLECVLQARGLPVLQEYENVLAKYYPQEILQKYTDEVNAMVKHTADRKRYREWVGILCRMTKIDGGEKKVCEIVEEWKRVYGNRRAMMEELGKLN